MKSLNRIACVHVPGVEVDDDEMVERCEAGAGHEATSAVAARPSVAFPATFAFQLSRQAGFFPKNSFRSL